jgi:hypothetical protein
MGGVGAADLIGIRNDGKFVSVEVKGPKTRITDEQRVWYETIRKFGGLAGIARSVADALEIVK